jgi:hypothetical protein
VLEFSDLNSVFIEDGEVAAGEKLNIGQTWEKAEGIDLDELVKTPDTDGVVQGAWDEEILVWMVDKGSDSPCMPFVCVNELLFFLNFPHVNRSFKCRGHEVLVHIRDYKVSDIVLIWSELLEVKNVLSCCEIIKTSLSLTPRINNPFFLINLHSLQPHLLTVNSNSLPQLELHGSTCRVKDQCFLSIVLWACDELKNETAINASRDELQLAI